MRSFAAILVVLGGAALAACSQGESVEATFAPGTGSVGAGGDGGSAGSTADASGTSSSTTSSASSTTSASGGGAGGEGGNGGAGGDGGTGAGGDPGAGGGGGTPCDFESPNDCLSPTEINALSGDSGGDTRTVFGTTSQWFKVQVQETSLLITDVSFTVTLEMPPGTDYDLFVYEGDAMSFNCLTSPVKATGSPETVSFAWGDAVGPDDNRWFGLEVRYQSGACEPPPKWKLTVKGNTN